MQSVGYGNDRMMERIIITDLVVSETKYKILHHKSGDFAVILRYTLKITFYNMSIAGIAFFYLFKAI